MSGCPPAGLFASGLPTQGLFASGLLAGLLVLAAGPAAAVTAADYQKWRHATRTVRATPTGLVEVRLGGVLSGLMLANRRLGRAGAPPLFCPPAGAPAEGMASDALRKRVDAELRAPTRPDGAPWPPETAIAVLVLHILQRDWRCPPARPAQP